MEWIILGITAHFFWAITNIGDKFIVGNKIDNPYMYNLVFKFLALPILVLIPFVGFYVPPATDMFWIMLGSFCFFLGGFPYTKAVQLEEITRIQVWWGLNPIYALLIELFVLGFVFTTTELVGFAVLLASTILASLHLSKQAFRFSKAVLYMIVSTLLFSAYGVIISQVVTHGVPFGVTFLWTTLWLAVFGLLSLGVRSIRKEYVRAIRPLSRMDLLLISILAVLSAAGIAFNQWALSLSSASFVFALEGSQAMFVFFIVAGISFVSPKLMKEAYDWKNVVVKICSIALMVVGVVVLSLN